MIFSTAMSGVEKLLGVVNPGMGFQSRLEHQRNIVLERKYKRLGRLVMLIFNPDLVKLHMPPTNGRKLLPAFNVLDWRGDPERPGPWLGLSTDHQDLLLYGDDGHFLRAVPHPPDIPDNSGPVKIDVEQRYSDRTTEALKNSPFLMIEPVMEIWFKPVGIASWAKIGVSEDFEYRRMTFLIDPNRGEGHLVGGRFAIGAAKG
jgi:hypothetical protein